MSKSSLRLPGLIHARPVFSAVASVLALLVITLPVWLATVWPLLSSRPFLEVMAARQWGGAMTGPLYGWLSVVLGIVNIALLLALIAMAKRAVTPPPLDANGAAGHPTSETGKLRELLVQRIQSQAYEFRPIDAGRRVFTSRTPNDIAQLAAMTPASKAKEAIALHVGQWLQIDGKVVGREKHDYYDTLKVELKGDSAKSLSVYLSFGLSMREVIHSLRVGDHIKANGQLDLAVAHSLTLRRCELLEHGGQELPTF